MRGGDRSGDYRRGKLRLTGGLLALWFAVTFAVPYFARELSFCFFGWPFSFWMGAQGTLILYVLLVAFYAWRMGRLDEAHGPAAEDAA
ncbi:DUF4212 domain-containing protein [Caldimonas tepidiphila]|uniref:DUF4212 domain-containing protein n=1 Tax=Caldimonas tepidiphila TaxID=2315841 RepID=UPI000E5A7AA9|nr:DUF4212 domain-containing protein [Caldimonas tepidiphila]